jgi:putative transposase
MFNSDQGIQFTGSAFTSRLEDRDVATSMDGRGCVFENIVVERLRRAAQYEDV